MGRSQSGVMNRGEVREAGREMQAERCMQAGPDIALAGAWAATRKGSLQQRQKLSRGRAKTCDQVVLVALPLILHVKVFRSRSCSLLLVSDQFQFASLQLSRTHQSRWRSFVFGLFLWLFVYRFYLYFLLFIIIFYQRHRSQTHTHTQAHKLGYRATLRAVWATLRKIKHSFSNSHSRTRSKPTLSRITNNELNKNNKQIKNNYTSRE